jgi:alkylhydroperoxidase/carboxymuconolactone decarboxylase family protein YurZ
MKPTGKTRKLATATTPPPPLKYREFIERFPRLADAWEALHDAGAIGPLDARVVRLAKLAVAIGAGREGAVRASVRKAVAAGISLDEIDQVVALAAGTIGMPAAVAAFSWSRDALAPARGNRKPAPRKR